MHYYQRPASVVTLAVFLPLIDTVAVTLRFYTRRKQRLPLKLDDWLTIPALILALGLAACLIIGVALHSFGYPTPSALSSRDLLLRTPLAEIDPIISRTTQLEWASWLMSTLALGFVKLSFLFFYQRIFCPNTKSVSNLIIVFMISVVVIWSISFFFAYLFICRGHFAAWWGPITIVVVQCPNAFLLLYVLAISDFIIDAIVILIPLPMIWNLHLPNKRKLAICAVFLLGAVAVGASITRLVFVDRDYHAGFDPNLDEDLLITEILYWTAVEVDLGLLAACLPTLSVLFKDVSGGLSKSIFSRFSLHSWGSQHSRLPEDSTGRVHSAQDGASTGSRSQILGMSKADKSDAETYVMQPVKG